ncbi:uncharacterized protein LOC110679536 [Aedes aegypti]|uniref:Uncharacterized protein n=1 Tax=Aedes aegypti TaxID=7159 RepID=A0A6I8U5T0_AEDAE|nr:uncharacterized protein LOC110679536 [Aedes aegypti]
MSTIACECHLWQPQPVACCGDFLCPLPPVGSVPHPCNGSGKSRVNAMRQLFERKIEVTENQRSLKGNNSAGCKSAPILRGNNQRRSIEERDVPKTTEQINVAIPDSTRFYRSHTKVVSIPNGVKIITTILAEDNLLAEDGCGTVYETLIYPESEIIRQFEKDIKRTKA